MNSHLKITATIEDGSLTTGPVVASFYIPAWADEEWIRKRAPDLLWGLKMLALTFPNQEEKL